jgi:hypothetical protein
MEETSVVTKQAIIAWPVGQLHEFTLLANPSAKRSDTN